MSMPGISGIAGFGGSAAGGSTVARYWRLRFPDGSPDAEWLAAREIEMRGTVGGGDLTSEAGAFASSISGVVNNAAQAFDGTTDPWFAASGAQVNAWIANDLVAPVDLEEILMYGENQHPEYMGTEIVVQYSHDGSTWFTDIRWPVMDTIPWWDGSGFGPLLRVRRPAGTERLLKAASLIGLGENSGGWNGFTLRQVIGAVALPAPGNRVRFSLRAGTSEGLAIAKCYVGLKGAGPYDFASTPTQVTFNGGSTGFSVGASVTQMSDDIALAIADSDSLVISMYCASAADTFRRSTSGSGGGTGITAGWKSGDTASDLTVSGYTSQNRNYMPNLEVWDTAS